MEKIWCKHLYYHICDEISVNKNSPLWWKCVTVIEIYHYCDAKVNIIILMKICWYKVIECEQIPLSSFSTLKDFLSWYSLIDFYLLLYLTFNFIWSCTNIINDWCVIIPRPVQGKSGKRNILRDWYTMCKGLWDTEQIMSYNLTVIVCMQIFLLTLLAEVNQAILFSLIR